MNIYKEKYIGEKQIKEVSEDKTPSGVDLMSIEYMDGTKEIVSSLMIGKIVSDESCDLTQLRKKRVEPVVEEILNTLRDWGLKISELSHLFSLLNSSIEFNQTQALIEMWSKYADRLLSPDDVSMLTVDKVLKEIKPEDNTTINDILNSKV